MTPDRWRQIEELYQAARDPEKRTSVLAAADPELRREVEALLAQESDSTVTQFAVGAQLGPYVIEAPLGAGGMGQVFRARDTRLGRAVAIKVAHEQFSARFEREARAISALNHPHICTLYDVGPNYLVMELVEGDTLAARLKKGPLPIELALRYGAEIADALAAAHAQGIIHRDLKPGNIMVAKNGVKVLDFGLAKSQRDRTLTATRVVMGTPAYMAPEQLEGKECDARSDIYALGLVLYEMATGKRLVQGQPLEGVPERLAPVVERCLAQDPDDRWQSAKDIKAVLEWAGQKQSATAVAGAKKTPARWMWVAAAILVALAMSAAVTWLTRGPAVDTENPLANAQFTRFTDFEGAEHDAALSSDGKFVAFRADRDGPFDVWLSQVGSGRFVNLTHGQDDEARLPLRSLGFSGDGSEIWLGGAPDRRLRLLPLMGGAPRVFLGDRVINVAWSPDGARIVYHTRDDGDPTFVADRTGANARQIFVSPIRPGGHAHFPTWSPDGRWIYFVTGIASTAEMDLWRIPSAGGKPERLTRHNNDVEYPTPIDARTVLYVAPEQDGSGPWLWALDVERKVTRRVSVGLEKYKSVAASADGRRLVATVANPSASLWSVPILDHPAEERDAKLFPLPTVNALAPRFGAGLLFYLSSRGAGNGLWRYQDGRVLEIWKGSDGALLEPAGVSPDGRRVAIVVRRNGKRLLHVLSSDGAEIQPLAPAIDVQGAPCWSPDGQWIVIGGNDGRGPGLFTIPLGGGSPVRLIPGTAINPVWSPDGSLIVYTGAGAAAFSPLLAVRADGSPAQLPDIQIRTRGDGERARFLPNGKALVYMQGLLPSQDFWLLDLAAKKTRQLTRLDNRAAMRTFDITPDGKQIVFDRLRENSDIVLIDLPGKNQ
jgi:Tol biopolymer transport system component/predicted Ser/Thr protein kinase